MALSLHDEFIEKIEIDPSNAEGLIEQFLIEKRAEDLHLDFTCKSDPGKGAISEPDKSGLSKGISAFANSDGGIIVWGVVAKGGHDPEDADVASATQPIQNIDAFHAQLNDLISRAVSPTVRGVRNLKIQRRANTSEGYVVTYVPAGETPPYRAELANKQYYKRSGSRSYPMEPFDIRDVVSRGKYPKIKIDATLLKVPVNGSNDFIELIVKLRNDGPSLDYSSILLAKEERML